MRKRDYLGSAVLLALSTLPGIASAAPEAGRPTAIVRDVTSSGAVSLRDLAGSAANAAALKAPHAVMAIHPLVHRMPDGTIGRVPAVLPRMAQPNVTVVGATLTPSKNITGFAGTYDGSNAQAIGGELEPPDQGIAVNNGQIFEIINNSLQVFDTTGKSLLGPVSNQTFFNTASNLNLSDPHVVFDASTQRWFVEELVYGNSFTGFALAVSQTSDPLGKYNVYQIDADTKKIKGCGTSLCLPDYPQVGYDANGFFIAADLFSNSTGNFVGTSLYALPKATLETGASVTYPYFVLQEFVLQPSIPAPGQAFETAGNGTEYLMTARNIFDNSSKVRVYAVSNTANITSDPSSLVETSVDLAGESYTGSVPSTEPNDVGPYGLSLGATTSPMLDGGYNAFGGGVKYAKGQLYAALATGTTDGNGLSRDVIAWFAVKPKLSKMAVSATLEAQGYVTPGDGYSLSFPSFALDAKGKGVIGFSITNSSAKVVGGYPSTGFVRFSAGTAATKITVVGKGSTSDDGFTGYGGSGPAGVGRWGDYGGGMVDAVTGIYYVANEFIPDTKIYPRGTYANWGTFITGVK